MQIPRRLKMPKRPWMPSSVAIIITSWIASTQAEFSGKQAPIAQDESCWYVARFALNRRLNRSHGNGGKGNPGWWTVVRFTVTLAS
jgi:hypothetical protein